MCGKLATRATTSVEQRVASNSAASEARPSQRAAFASSLPVMTEPSRPRIALYAVLTLVSLPLGYYAVQESIRYRVLRKRRRRYAQKIERRAASEAKVDEEASATEHEAVHELFASLSVLGRYQNPFSEWREEGAWEWVFWQLLWRPITLRVLWSGGISDPAERARILPSERPDFKRIFGVEPESTNTGRLTDLTVLDSLLPADNIEEVRERDPSTVLKRTESPDDWIVTSRSSDPGASAHVTSELTCTWFGQSTCFITLDGACILTDPVFGDRLVERFGPQRLRPPPAPLADLLRVDVVLVSHDHFDHLEYSVVDYLHNTTLWVIPLGLAPFFRSRGVTRILELDWWQSETLPIPGQPRVTFCPTMHWSGRTPSTTYQSLWGCYVVQGQREKVFHCGDTGYVPALYESIGRLYGPFDLALLPIGAYQPRWHLAPQHIDPDSAVRIHKSLRSKRSIGYHWGTWSLSDDRYDDPPRDLDIARKLHDVDEAVFSTVPLGWTLVL